MLVCVCVWMQKDLVHQVVLRLPVHEILENASDPAARQQFESAMEDLYRQDAESGTVGLVESAACCCMATLRQSHLPGSIVVFFARFTVLVLKAGGAGEVATAVQAMHISNTSSVETNSKRQRKEQ